MRALFFIPGIVCLFLGGIFLLVFRRGKSRAMASEHSMTAQGWAKLVDTESRTEYSYENRARTVYYGIYEIDAADGRRYSSASDFGYPEAKSVPGARGNLVKVCYDPNDPNKFALPEEQAVFNSVWPKFRKTGIILSVLGILFTAAAITAMLGIFDSLPDRLINQAEGGSISFNYTSGRN